MGRNERDEALEKIEMLENKYHNNDDDRVDLQKLLEEKSREVEDSYKRINKMREEIKRITVTNENDYDQRSLQNEINKLKEKIENDQVTIYEQKEELANLQSQADSLSQLLDENEDLRNENYNLVVELNNEKEANTYLVKNLENNDRQTSEN